MQDNREPKGSASALWFGTGIHFALEDFHGYNQYGHAREAFLDFVEACRIRGRQGGSQLPSDWQELKDLGSGMMEYYIDHWLPNRDPLQTFVFDGRPAVEVNFELEIPFDPKKLKAWGWDRVVYAGTLDRVAIDPMDRLWVVEYKTAKTIQTGHLLTDSQVSTYIMALRALFGMPVGGVIYQQHWKALPDLPYILANGKVSVNKAQKTTHSVYRQTLKDLYGDVQKAPKVNVDFLNHLALQETPDADRYIRRDEITRNEHSGAAESVKILLECEDMLNPDLPMYPNPTRDCSWDCPFRSPCVSIDDGSDFEHELELGFVQSKGREDRWRKHLKQPKAKELPQSLRLLLH